MCSATQQHQIVVTGVEARLIVLTHPQTEIKQRDKDLLGSEGRNFLISTSSNQSQ